MPSTKSKKEKISRGKTDGAVDKIRAQVSKIESSLKEQHVRLAELEKKLKNLSSLEPFSPEKLRGELIEGIRLLGEKVSVAVQEINRRHEKFSDELNERLADLENQIADRNQNNAEQKSDSSTMQLKESRLLEEDDFEIVPRDAIEKLIDLSKKQAAAIKDTVTDLRSQMVALEEKIHAYSNEPSVKGSKRNNKIMLAVFIISIVALVLSIISFILISY